MEFKVQGAQNADAECVVNVTPKNATTVIKGEHPNQVIFQPSTNFVTVGKFPCSVKFTILFHLRPWTLEIQQKGGAYFSTNNESQGLPTKTILTPDIVTINLKYEVA
ncbi:MAG: hypothetical protein U0U09_11255 [Cyclobacteriaceae bacterium]